MTEALDTKKIIRTFAFVRTVTDGPPQETCMDFD